MLQLKTFRVLFIQELRFASRSNIKDIFEFLQLKMYNNNSKQSLQLQTNSCNFPILLKWFTDC